jgi:hypothetical protein
MVVLKVKPTARRGQEMVIFSESTTHGTLAWRPEHRHRCCVVYRYSPKYLACAPPLSPSSAALCR